ncbi:MAG: thioredoxin-disulfide reductase [Endomicrobium sp.]|jgi:thioredoxin reductase (NADPH)|nr:thioredoxin-disulfide reductase [Endomicrobium sp.]
MIYDIIIIGGGPAGLTAAVYASRARLSTLLIEKSGCGGQMVITDLLENYPGFNGGVNGFDLSMKLEAQAKEFGTVIAYDEVVDLELEGDIKRIVAVNDAYEAKTVIIAAGANIKKLGIDGEEKFIGNGISFCAVCDAPFFKEKDVLVVGGGDSALQEAVYLAKFAKNVVLAHRRDEFRAAKILQERIQSHPNISVMLGYAPEEIIGTHSIEGVKLKNLKTLQTQILKVQGVFVFIGRRPNTDFIHKMALDEGGYIITDENMKTSVEGVFACGDIRKKLLRQVVTAASDGAQAAFSAQHYLENL